MPDSQQKLLDKSQSLFEFELLLTHSTTMHKHIILLFQSQLLINQY